MTMRAFRVSSHDAPPKLETCAKPRPGPGQMRLKVHACGLNFADLLMISGRYQDTPALPFTLGMEVSGVVDALGPDQPAGALAIGSRALACCGHGGLADYACFATSRAVALPKDMSHTAAAGFPIAYGTSHLALAHRAQLRPGETLLVLGAAGGVGLSAVEIGSTMGARVIACARGATRLKAAQKAGAHHLIDTDKQDIREACKALGGADVVFDPVGGEAFTAAMRACRPEARILTIGFASGDVPAIPANHLLVKNLTVMGLYWGGYLSFAPEVLTRSLATLLGWVAEGRITPHAHHIYPLARVAEGLELLRTRSSTGKIVVTTG